MGGSSVYGMSSLDRSCEKCGVICVPPSVRSPYLLTY